MLSGIGDKKELEDLGVSLTAYVNDVQSIF